MNILDRINEKLIGTIGIAIAPVRAAALGAATYLATAGIGAVGSAADVAASSEGSLAVASATGMPWLAPVIAALAVGLKRKK